MSDTHAESVAFVRETTLPPVPPPVAERGIYKWSRENLFATPLNALLTVATTNRPSLRVIEKEGGVFDGQTTSPRRGETMRRYWIETAREVSP